MAQDTATLIINKNTAGATIINNNDSINTITIKKVNAALLKTIALQLKGTIVNNIVYKKTVVVLDENEVILSAEEDKNTTGRFTLPIKLITKKLIAKKKIKLLLQLNPANDMMMMPSRQIQLCYVLMK